jgi:hypothetical protein
MLDDRTKMLLRALLYPVQFEAKPENGIDRVVRSVILRSALNASPMEYQSAIVTALDSTDKLSEIIPQDHNERTTRNYLNELSSTLRQLAIPVPARF